MPDRRFEQHEIEWTPEKVQRFWDWWARMGPDDYFAEMVGGDIVRFAQRAGIIGPRVLDFGCGRGYLLEKLVAAGVACEGVDLSRESVETARARLGAHPLFRGATVVEGIPTTLPGATYDTIFFIETVEHLLPELALTTLEEITRLLRPGGHVLLTTPNEEDLVKNRILCPDCGCVFHRVQHVQSFSRGSMRALLEQSGLEPVKVVTCNLRRPFVLNPILDALRRARARKDQNLVAIGRRPG